MYSAYSRARIDDRQVTELIGILRGISVDNRLAVEELDLLIKWKAANPEVQNNPVVAKLYSEINDTIRNSNTVEEKKSSLIDLFIRFTGSDFEIGEDLKAIAAFFSSPTPEITIPGKRFCFTGTFLFGTRKDVENATAERGGTSGVLAKTTNFLVVGEYATDSWIQPSFGRKMEKAIDLQDSGTGLQIVSESDWRKVL